MDDTTMAVRMVEYDFAIALEKATKIGRMYEMDFPESCVLYLRHGKNTPDKLEVKVNLPNGNHFIYECKILKVQSYTKDAIFEKKLLFFLPYYIMRYEKQLDEIAEDSEKRITLLKDYEDLRSRLENELFKDNRSVLYADMVKLIIRISDYILEKNQNIKEGVSDAMGGKVLELESERLIKIGKAEGRYETLINLVKKGVVALADAAEEAGISEEAFVSLLNEKQHN